MEVRSLAIPDVRLFVPRRIGDERGYFAEVFRADVFAQHVCAPEFVQDNESMSARAGTVRGLHFQSEPAAQGKLVRCTAGALFDVAVDIRKGSATYGQWVGEELSAANGRQLWIPAGFAHGFCTLVKTCRSFYIKFCDNCMNVNRTIVFTTSVQCIVPCKNML